MKRRVLDDAVLVQGYLRQVKRSNGEPGAYTLRFLVWLDGDTRLKPRRVELGLGTADMSQAVFAARLVLQGLAVLGAKFSGALAGLERRRVLRQPGARRQVVYQLPLFELPPAPGVDGDAGGAVASEV